VKARRLIELWEPPEGYRLASVVATTYELQADFLEEDLLPVALDLRLPSARGRDFRLELERALQDAEVSVFFHPGRYQPGLRRSPRIDLVPLPEGRFPKLHAKVALLRFVAPVMPEFENHVVRLVVGSANLTNPGFRTNIEVATFVDDAPSASDEAATVVRHAASWLESLVTGATTQVDRQLRDMNAVFASRPFRRQDARLRFIGLPSDAGFPLLAAPDERVSTLTIVSPFWPTGDDLSDVAAALRRLCGGQLETVRLVGPADIDDQGVARPVIPAGLVRALHARGARVEVAAADPGHGCETTDDDATAEFDEVAERRASPLDGSRSLHAKVIVAEGATTVRLAIGSFNLTRKGLGLTRNANLEAGLLWTLPRNEAVGIKDILSFATAWRNVTPETVDLVVEPEDRDGANNEQGAWPRFLISIRALRDALIVEGDALTWPDEVCIRMRDIRSRLLHREEWFDTWTIRSPGTQGAFSVTTQLQASWLESVPAADAEPWTVLPDLEAEVAWDSHTVSVPVVFEEKHLFPVVESKAREDEQSLIAWFLGLRPAGEGEDSGFGHSIDPIPGAETRPSLTGDILSYLVRGFVHALPGIHQRLAEAGMTETGLRTALLGHRSPVELAREALRALRSPQLGKPRKTVLATAFQLAELVRLLRTTALPELADGTTEALRAEAIAKVQAALDDVIAALPEEDATPVVRDYLGLDRSAP